ncbi:LolA family protein [Sphingobacterium hungaricum]|uniref:Cell envelope biogenesis protein LolA n=1 Tax=Sphingobacterium hungaricum TaxID=2082723 RepID=A0A928YS42_9SPHI|nr:outer membrane lipoprotein carrier protein LolA [Sphingobacterium hungaricum]MBE8713893.1 cell envelope biogenesis protein LolA [Sphingobacterium hungaricum]
MSFKSILSIFFLLISVQLFAQDRAMTATEIAPFKKVVSNAVKVKTLSADFTQYKKLGFVDKEIISSGKIYVVHPEKMSWVYSSPTNYSMIFKNNKIFINDQGKKNTVDVGKNKQFEKISQMIANGIAGELDSSKDYSISYFQNTGFNIVQVTPKAKDAQKYIQQIILSFDKKDNQVAEIKLLEPSKNYTRFVLKNIKTNQTINEQVFAN